MPDFEGNLTQYEKDMLELWQMRERWVRDIGLPRLMDKWQADIAALEDN